MGLLDKLKFKMWDNAGAVVDVIRRWEPGDCKTEKEYERSLYAFLHDVFGDLQVTKQYAQGRVRADLCVAGKVILELKNNLDTTAKYQRLVGQIAEYKNWNGRIVILLTGTTEPNLRKQLDKFVEKEGLGAGLTMMDMEPKVVVVQK